MSFEFSKAIEEAFNTAADKATGRKRPLRVLAPICVMRVTVGTGITRFGAFLRNGRFFM